MLKRIVSIKYFGIIFLKKEITVSCFNNESALNNKVIKYFLFGTFKVKEITENYTRE